MARKAAETIRNINNESGTGTANECTMQYYRMLIELTSSNPEIFGLVQKYLRFENALKPQLLVCGETMRFRTLSSRWRQNINRLRDSTLTSNSSHSKTYSTKTVVGRRAGRELSWMIHLRRQ
ncbi:hypothetical protein KIN20_032915 [Parelaphostrongylus tenuis]|uniref:Uncharacterized protein n=1 Tax=Parelaphostrongylus tenuis TaxID=148309 RepID=A0AAD5WID2_PARTN|nr:hypothetical protein KIN20_032915 [Parelaphostrongylus tenuis]